jgi:hypothetical protein
LAREQVRKICSPETAAGFFLTDGLRAGAQIDMAEQSTFLKLPHILCAAAAVGLSADSPDHGLVRVLQRKTGLFYFLIKSKPVGMDRMPGESGTKAGFAIEWEGLSLLRP